MWYSPRANQLINLTDTVDMVSGWEEYIVVDMCEKMMLKEESFESATGFAQIKAALIKRVEDEAENRNVGEPQTVSDNKMKNFSWTDGQSGGGDGGFGGGGSY
jgi:hypothetical protein